MRRILIFSAGLLVGASVGAMATLLLTPASGDDMRQGARNHFQHMLTESARAAAARRAELEAELAELTGQKSEDADSAA